MYLRTMVTLLADKVTFWVSLYFLWNYTIITYCKFQGGFALSRVMLYTLTSLSATSGRESRGTERLRNAEEIQQCCQPVLYRVKQCSTGQPVPHGVQQWSTGQPVLHRLKQQSTGRRCSTEWSSAAPASQCPTECSSEAPAEHPGRTTWKLALTSPTSGLIFLILFCLIDSWSLYIHPISN